MEKKRNLPPASSQLVELPLKQHKWEAEQENDQAFEQTNSVFGALSSPALRSSMSSSIPVFSSSYTSLGAFKQWQTNSMFGASCSPAFRSSMRRSSSTPPAFDDSSIFQTVLEAVSKEMELKDIQTAEAVFAATPTLPFRMERFSEVGEPHTPSTLISIRAITEEVGGTFGQTAKLESISAMPAYNNERYQSCFAIAGEDYCLIAADFTYISELSGKSVMVSCGFQDDMKALQQALSAENLRYECKHNKPMSCPEMRSLLSDFEERHPNHVFIVLGGLDSEGKGRVFQLFGPDEDVAIASEGGPPGSRLIGAPILKYQLPAKDVLARLSETEAVHLAKDVFKSATNTGDELEIVVLNANGLRRYNVDLRKEKKK